ncbi:MAG TPA: kelch repeat-containing protein, partial [Candidatus Methylomirabilis sp.]
MSLTRRQFVTAISGIAGVWVGAHRGVSAATWRRGGDAPTPRSEVAAAVLGGKIYIVGGFGGGTGGLVEVYDPATDRW